LDEIQGVKFSVSDVSYQGTHESYRENRLTFEGDRKDTDNEYVPGYDNTDLKQANGVDLPLPNLKF
jgi:uncharacterized protein (DUF39 family)